MSGVRDPRPCPSFRPSGASVREHTRRASVAVVPLGGSWLRRAPSGRRGPCAGADVRVSGAWDALPHPLETQSSQLRRGHRPRLAPPGPALVGGPSSAPYEGVAVETGWGGQTGPGDQARTVSTPRQHPRAPHGPLLPSGRCSTRAPAGWSHGQCQGGLLGTAPPSGCFTAPPCPLLPSGIPPVSAGTLSGGWLVGGGGGTDSHPWGTEPPDTTPSPGCA